MAETPNNASGDPSGSDVPKKHRLLDYLQRQCRNLCNWIWRESVRSFAKSMAWVVPLTVLIWVYAEREQRTQTVPWPIPITVKTTVPNKHVALLSSDRNIMARLAGPRGLVDEVTNTLTSGSPQRVEILLPADMLGGRGRTIINVPTSLVANNQLFRSRDITVFDCSPATIQVEVDDMVDQQLTVSAPPDVTILDGIPTFTPPTILFHGPSKLLETFPRSEEGKIIIYADFSDRAMFRPDGTQTAATLPLKGPANSTPSTLTPVTVEAKFTLKQEDVKGMIRAMPVFVLVPQAVLQKFNVEYEASLANVAVSGPRDLIEKLNTDALTPAPKAILEILPDDQPGTSISRSPQFRLPVGLKIAGDAPVKISFQLKPKTPE